MGFLGWLGDQASSAADAVGDAANATWGAVTDAAGTVRDDVGSAFGFDTRAENAQQERAANAKEQGQQLREELAQRNQRLNAPAGYDPPSITQQENWQSYDHQRIYDTNQNTLSQSDAEAVGEAWRNIGEELGEIGERLRKDSAKAIDSGWSGQAAEAAKESAQPLAEWMSGSGESFRMTGNKIAEAGSAAGQVKAMVPPPKQYDKSQAVTAGLLSAGTGVANDAVRQMNEQKQAERSAQETMSRVMGATYQNVDGTVPAYKDLDGNETKPQSKPGDGGGTGSGTGGTGGYGGTGGVGGVGGGGPVTAGYPNGSGVTGGSPGQSAQPGWNGSGSGGGQLPGGGYGSAGNESAWATNPGGPGAGGAQGGAGAAGGVAGGRGAAGGAGGGAGAGGYAGGGVPGGAGAGRGGAVGPGGRAGTGATPGSGSSGSGAAASGASGRSGGGRMPMGGGAGQNQGGEEEEHERPSWLEEWDDVWFNDMPRTAPPVIE
ncbi:PPE domain-containing protein [Actinopolyspora saharensis]|uniref:PPE family protein n=1 Tax=Actinopolyspora saharensis TaxID=995062 RepID=A0A1H1FIC0_9ACTN|nr:PPE domain-containing protein [Actinopolyspora saharensis]SDR00685.1 PPE family protein [Actinopolyspora saharensis]